MRFRIILPKAIIFAALGLAGVSRAESRFALLIGINNYAYITGLKGCVTDVSHMRDNLPALGFVTGNITHRIQDKAKKTTILRDLASFAGKLKKDDLMLIYFSGHGTRFPDSNRRSDGSPAEKDETDGADEAVCLYDTELGKDSTALTDDDLRAEIKKLALLCKHVVFIMDCCSSGEGTLKYGEDSTVAREVLNSGRLSVTTSHSKLELDMDVSQYPQDHLLLAACLPDQKAIESSLIPKAPRCGVFTWFLIQAVKDKKLTPQEKWKSVRDNVGHITAGKQAPALYGNQSFLDILFSSPSPVQ